MHRASAAAARPFWARSRYPTPPKESAPCSPPSPPASSREHFTVSLERAIPLASLHLGRAIMKTLTRSVLYSRSRTRGKNRGSGAPQRSPPGLRRYHTQCYLGIFCQHPRTSNVRGACPPALHDQEVGLAGLRVNEPRVGTPRGSAETGRRRNLEGDRKTPQRKYPGTESCDCKVSSTPNGANPRMARCRASRSS